MTLLDLFDGTLADRAASFAIDDVTYADLDRGARRAAALLAARGLRAGDRLAIFCENRHAFVYAYLGALRMGAIVVPANVLYRTGELEHVFQTAGVELAIVSEQTREHLNAIAVPPATIDASELERAALDPAAPALERDAQPRLDPAAVALIIFTSGTTGRSKGAMLTHDNVAAIAMQVVTAWRWTSADTLAIALPLFHVHGLGAAFNGTLVAGGRLLVHERFDARRMLATLEDPGVTMFFGVPTMYVRLLEATEDRERVPLGLRLCVSGSAALSADVHRAFEGRFGVAILERYGATEFGFALGNRYGGPRVAGSVGIPFPGTRVRVVEPSSLADVAPGEVGELLVAGPTVCRGYWNRPDAEEGAFIRDESGDRWYRSGDLARYDPNDDVYAIVGRIKELIISGGFNIYPREVELEIERLPGVRACAVVGIADAARGELPIAFVEADAPFDSEAARDELRTRLASFKVPREIHVVEALPRNAMGKLEKTKLAALRA